MVVQKGRVVYRVVNGGIEPNKRNKMKKNPKGRLNKLIGKKMPQNLRMIEVGGDFQRSFDPITAQARSPRGGRGPVCLSSERLQG